MTTAAFDRYRGMRVCVTGGAGFIGSHLCDALVEHGARVTVIDDLSQGLRANLDGVATQVRLVEASILDESALADALDGATIVFHQAALASVPRSVEDPDRYFEVNAIGTHRVLESARRQGVERVVYAASSSVYGDQPGQPRVETMAPDPRSPYAATKCVGEQLLRAYASCYGMSGVSLRYFNIFGPRQRPDSPYAAVVPRFAEALGAGRRPVIYGDGEQTRDFTFVANAVDANLLAGASERDLAGEVVNVGCGEGLSVNALLEAVARELGVEPACDREPARTGDVRDSVASIDATRALIGYEPLVDLATGLRGTVGWYVRGTR
jgi:UDP-glucose 4-epimerase